MTRTLRAGAPLVLGLALATACGTASSPPGFGGGSSAGGSSSSGGSSAGGSSSSGGSSSGGSSGAGGTNACSSALDSGFAPQPVAFSVPAPRCQRSFRSMALDTVDLSYGLLDLTGDGKPDLVVSGDGCDTSVGTSHWDVYAAGASGFAASPTPFAVPAPRCQRSFRSMALDTVDLAYGLLDLTGDGKPDLVVSGDGCDTSVGTSHWDVYAAGASGFAASPTPFAVPAPRCQRSFRSMALDTVDLSYGLLDLTGDGKPALVVFGDGCDTSVGSSHWDVYAAGTSGFAATPTPFAVPAPRCRRSFDASALDTVDLSYATSRLTGGCTLDLTVTSDGCDESVGTTHWDRYVQH